MSDSFLGDGLIFDDCLPAAWIPGPLPDETGLARLNADNQQWLSADLSLDEGRMHEALKDESPALVHELQRLDFKMNILLRLMADLARRQSVLPEPRPIRFSAHGMEWSGDDLSALGSTGLLILYVNPSLPQPLRLPSRVCAASTNGASGTRLQFTGLSESVVELIEKMIFRHHRRLIAGARLAPTRHS